MFYRGNVQRKHLLKQRKKKKPVQHPEWDSTVHDLTVHAASPEEMMQRQLRRKSKNADAAKRELIARKKGLPVDLILSPGQVELEMKKLAVLREVLYDHNDFNEVLRKTDRTMSRVKDIFQDSATRKSANPNITLAPGRSSGQPSVIPTIAEQPSKLDALSDSVMDQQALNHQESSDESEYEDDVQFESRVDCDRFLSLLKDSMNNKRKIPVEELLKTPTEVVKPPPKQNPALNCTEEVKRTLSRISSIKPNDTTLQDTTNNTLNNTNAGHEQKRKIDTLIGDITKDAVKLDKKLNLSIAPPIIPLKQTNKENKSTNLSYDNLQDALGEVGKNISEFEERTGRKNDQQSFGGGLAGFTATLIDAVTRLTTYVNEGEIKQQGLENSLKFLCEKLENQEAFSKALTEEVERTQAEMTKNRAELLATVENLKRENEEKEKWWKEENERVKQQLKVLSQSVEDQNREQNPEEQNLDISTNTIKDEVEIVDIVQDKKICDKEAEEIALKGDMLKLLTALKTKNSQTNVQTNVQLPATSQNYPQPSTLASQPTNLLQEYPSNPIPTFPTITAPLTQPSHPLPSGLFDGASNEAAHTIASVESHLRHLKLQHAEAQQRMEELNKQTNKPFIPSTSAALHPPFQQDSSCSDTNIQSDSTSLASLPRTLPPQVYQQYTPHNPANLSASFSQLTPHLQPPPSDFAAPPNKFLEEFDASDVGSFKFLEQDTDDVASNVSVVSSLLESPQVLKQQQAVLSSIQKTQVSLEDRISELNKQHTEAQDRLQKLVARRRNELPSKKVQVSVPSADMFMTPHIRKPSTMSKNHATADWVSLASPVAK